jgi:outer membrane protein TolC
MKKKINVVFLFLSWAVAIAQKDTTTLDSEQYLQIVKQYHPVVKLVNIGIEKSNADLQIARGAFSPIISYYKTNKTFDNVTYYNYSSPAVVVPTWFGVDFVVGIENLSGGRFDPSETVGRSNYTGVSIPLLKNLVIDKRRAYLKQAKIYTEMAITEQQIAVNDILQEAIVQYWDWVNAYQVYKITTKNYDNSKRRFELIKKTFLNGDRPAIDTIEAMTQFQNFEFQKNEARLIFQNEGVELNVFLWKQNNEPYQLPPFVVPQSGWENETNIQQFSLKIDELLMSPAQFHPALELYAQKSKVLDIDKKMKFQELLPKLDFKYNHLAKGYHVFDSQGLLFQNNFQYGLKLEMPLMPSQGRGEYKKAKLKIEENKINQAQKAFVINQKINSYYNDYNNLKTQISLQSSMLLNFQKLLTAEETLFVNGESSLFLINSRESKVLETERKLVELKTKYFKTIYALQWSAGLLE